MRKNNYGVADIKNHEIASDIVAVDISTTAFEPGYEFVPYATGTGNLVVTTVRGTEVTIGVGNHQKLDCFCTKIDTSGNGTSATGIFAFRN